jgi:hypothetical protein
LPKTPLFSHLNGCVTVTRKPALGGIPMQSVFESRTGEHVLLVKTVLFSWPILGQHH